MGKTLEDLRIYRAAESLCDNIWHNVIAWERFARDTVGKQLVDITFVMTSSSLLCRGSAKEAGFWLRRAQNRGLIEPEKCSGFIEGLTLLEPQLNAYINSIRRKANGTHTE